MKNMLMYALTMTVVLSSGVASAGYQQRAPKVTINATEVTDAQIISYLKKQNNFSSDSAVVAQEIAKTRAEMNAIVEKNPDLKKVIVTVFDENPGYFVRFKQWLSGGKISRKDNDAILIAVDQVKADKVAANNFQLSLEQDSLKQRVLEYEQEQLAQVDASGNIRSSDDAAARSAGASRNRRSFNAREYAGQQDNAYNATPVSYDPEVEPGEGVLRMRTPEVAHGDSAYDVAAPVIKSEPSWRDTISSWFGRSAKEENQAAHEFAEFEEANKVAVAKRKKSLSAHDARQARIDGAKARTTMQEQAEHGQGIAALNKHRMSIKHAKQRAAIMQEAQALHEQGQAEYAAQDMYNASSDEVYVDAQAGVQAAVVGMPEQSGASQSAEQSDYAPYVGAIRGSDGGLSYRNIHAAYDYPVEHDVASKTVSQASWWKRLKPKHLCNGLAILGVAATTYYVAKRIHAWWNQKPTAQSLKPVVAQGKKTRNSFVRSQQARVAVAKTAPKKAVTLKNTVTNRGVSPQIMAKAAPKKSSTQRAASSPAVSLQSRAPQRSVVVWGSKTQKGSARGSFGGKKGTVLRPISA